MPSLSRLSAMLFARFARHVVVAAGLTLILASHPASAQSGRGGSFAGTWSVQVADAFGSRQSCSIELTGPGSIMGAHRANPRGCGSALVSVSRWQAQRGGISLNDISDRPLIMLRFGRGGLFGADEAGRPIRLTASGMQSGYGSDLPSFGSAPFSSGCSVYYGQSQRCAESRDLAAPRLAPGQTATVRIVYPFNLRQFPSLGAPALALIPVDTCIVADSCARQSDGAEWCRMRWSGLTGYVVKTFERDGRRRILFSNGCGPG
ncbi:conserved exported hypothetical protein [Bosea sp. 62]|uniref:AprI/Inh family metalloprotease inhibitor n=1 Tax=unclassified Bosea (in: a-proteobacteria) TaxID=2653178 RepID=UPI0012565BA9|nr:MULTISPECIES: AprI/Inh family metalloprotease inhibitor [unclassified Bosea (in: a-proteobacteria)]CAD5292062.1 conserved exported hypothetical protein [Bosea sp. 7B]CAD5299352.1 conserved exported hypothetical protein [Bosea sp. 21B]CAD5299486.1 conserved exported hypothetical protein [Bosea sp. 46]VVT61667.1 conserved exported hypothetical protein [Bosea sp. EC-HK365B]VXB06374.1 conserved exported hypothetical protein [Bosea sp. 127]